MRLNPLDPRINATRGGTAHAHFFLHHYEKPVSWSAIAIQDNPDGQPGLRISAASNAMAGRLEQQKAVARLRQLNPALRISNLKGVLGPYRQAEYLARYEEGLRRAGLPEEPGCPNDRRSRSTDDEEERRQHEGARFASQDLRLDAPLKNKKLKFPRWEQ